MTTKTDQRTVAGRGVKIHAAIALVLLYQFTTAIGSPVSEWVNSLPEETLALLKMNFGSIIRHICKNQKYEHILSSDSNEGPAEKISFRNLFHPSVNSEDNNSGEAVDARKYLMIPDGNADVVNSEEPVARFILQNNFDATTAKTTVPPEITTTNIITSTEGAPASTVLKPKLRIFNPELMEPNNVILKNEKHENVVVESLDETPVQPLLEPSFYPIYPPYFNPNHYYPKNQLYSDPGLMGGENEFMPPPNQLRGCH